MIIMIILVVFFGKNLNFVQVYISQKSKVFNEYSIESFLRLLYVQDDCSFLY